MPNNTPLGYPYPVDEDPVNIAADMGALADAVDASPGITPLTQTEIDNLSVAEAREGRLVYNLTTQTVQQRVSDTWVNVETQVGAQTKADTAQAAANAYTDTAIADLVGAAPAVLDTLEEIAEAINQDDDFATSVTTSLTNAITNLEAYADQAEADAVTAAAADATTKANAAETNAKDYTDSELSTAVSNLEAYADQAETDAITSANTYTDGAISTTVSALQSYADQTETDAITAAAADATTKANAAETSANTYTDGEISTLNTSLRTYADQAEADAVTTAATDASTKADAAQAAAEATAASDATTKANAAESAANTYTDIQVGVVSGDLASHEAATTSVHGIADTSDLVVSTDARLSDARIPTTHATTHGAAGSDPISPADIGAAATGHTHDYQVRRDTSANWTAANPTLLQGEWALETDTQKTKLGDGVTAWNSLEYFLEDVPHMYVQTTTPTMVTGDLWLDVSNSV